MRRFVLSAAMLAVVAGGPLQAYGGDREIAQQIIEKLKVHRDNGTLKDFTLDLKVDQGVVLLRGSVIHADQKADVLAAAEGIDGIAKVVDEIEVREAVAAEQAAAEPAKKPQPFSFKEALAAAAVAPPTAAGPTAAPTLTGPTPRSAGNDLVAKPVTMPLVTPASQLAPSQTGEVQPAAATDSDVSPEDADVTAAVVDTLGSAQRQGRLKGFGVDVNTRDGRVYLNGRARSEEQRRLILDLVRATPGVYSISEDISVVPAATGNPPELRTLPEQQSAAAAPLNRAPAAGARNTTAARPAAMRTPAPVQNAAANPAAAQRPPVPYQAAGFPQGAPMMPADCPPGGFGSGYTGMPQPMGPYAGVGVGPRYEQPYLPNYAWPGYAAYPNYAAVSYPQQYSPSAFPYIGPFYPYPQVPLGWRKVCLEWDDGWWFLDFTDR